MWISYKLEIYTRAYLPNEFRKIVSDFGLGYNDLVRINQHSRDYFVRNQETLNAENQFKYKLREPIFKLGLEKIILFANLNQEMLEGIKENLLDQFKKIKQKFCELI